MVGILEEQHPDRARLFMQWKRMGWPLLVDSYNLLGVPYVPITLAIDEYGVIRAIHPAMQKPAEIEQSFLAQRYEQPAGYRGTGPRAPDLSRLRPPAASAPSTAWRDYGDSLAVWGDEGRLSDAIAAYQRAAKLDPADLWSRFRLGVAYRKRYDSGTREADDFQHAAESWAAALDIDPNQYIFRRRIQQYGPRLDKPYSFYDWVVTARQEIAARGETPVSLSVEPGGAEFAAPLKVFGAAESDSAEPPDPKRRIIEDDGRFIRIETVTVPPSIKPGAAARAHVVFRPNLAIKSHWNNEQRDGLRFWIDPPPKWQVDARSLSFPNPREPVSQETRKLEFEIRALEGVKPGSHFIPGYALYYVCEDVNGVCMYRRQNATVEVVVRR